LRLANKFLGFIIPPTQEAIGLFLSVDAGHTNGTVIQTQFTGFGLNRDGKFVKFNSPESRLLSLVFFLQEQSGSKGPGEVT